MGWVMDDRECMISDFTECKYAVPEVGREVGDFASEEVSSAGVGFGLDGVQGCEGWGSTATERAGGGVIWVEIGEGVAQMGDERLAAG